MKQKKWVIQQLREHGRVTRNQALANYISRLGAIIYVLKNEGYEFTTSDRDGDYVYTLVDAPKRQIRVDSDPVTRVATRVYA